MRKNLKFILILSICISLVIAIELTKPVPINWAISFSKSDKIPFGNYIMYQLLPDIFQGKNISAVYDSIHDILKDKTFNKTSYIVINNIFDPDKLDMKELLRFISDGNSAFIVAHHFGKDFTEELKLETAIYGILDGSISINFLNKALKKSGNYIFKKHTTGFYFSSLNKKGTSVIGVNEKKQANFIKISYGKGTFFLSTVPFAFTNYNMLLDKNHDYIFKSLSYLPVQDTIWDEYYKSGKVVPKTPLRFILKDGSLKWAYYLSMSGLLLFILFRARRKQRIIPEIKPLTNSTLEFISTIGRLYFQKGDHKNIAEKKILYFLDFIRSRFFIEKIEFSDSLYKQVALKSGLPFGDIKNIFNNIILIRNEKKISEKQLVQLNRDIEIFYKNVEILTGETQIPGGKGLKNKKGIKYGR